MVLLLLLAVDVVKPWRADAQANCAGLNTQCNVEATIAPGFLEQGVQSTFFTVTGNTAEQRVNSIALDRDNGPLGEQCIVNGFQVIEQVEIGWLQDVGDPAGIRYFRVYCINKTFSQLLGSSISGTHTYRVEYSASLNRWDFKIDGGSLWSTHAAAVGWNTGHPVTNAERDSRQDSFTVGPAFQSLWYRSSANWIQWNQLGAVCFFDNDPDLKNSIRMDINSVIVLLGAGGC